MAGALLPVSPSSSSSSSVHSKRTDHCPALPKGVDEETRVENRQTCSPLSPAARCVWVSIADRTVLGEAKMGVAGQGKARTADTTM